MKMRWMYHLNNAGTYVTEKYHDHVPSKKLKEHNMHVTTYHLVVDEELRPLLTNKLHFYFISLLFYA